MCIKFFQSLTTGIYSLALSSPSRLRQTLLDPKEKTIEKINYLKYYNRIIKIFAESGSSSPSLTSSATLHRPSTRASGSASSKNILLAHRTDFHRPIPTLCIFWFLPNRPSSLHKNQ